MSVEYRYVVTSTKPDIEYSFKDDQGNLIAEVDDLKLLDGVFRTKDYLTQIEEVKRVFNKNVNLDRVFVSQMLMKDPDDCYLSEDCDGIYEECEYDGTRIRGIIEVLKTEQGIRINEIEIEGYKTDVQKWLEDDQREKVEEEAEERRFELLEEELNRETEEENRSRI